MTSLTMSVTQYYADYEKVALYTVVIDLNGGIS
jgi:hypothetical protein